MSKARHDDPDISDEYDFSNAVRGKYYDRMKDGYTIHIVTDEEDRQRQARVAEEAEPPNPDPSGEVTRP